MNRRRGCGCVSVLLIILLSPLFILLYATKVEPGWIQVTRWEVRLPNLPPSADGMRVVLMADLHRSGVKTDPIIRHAVQLANAEQPDLVCLAGDFIEHDRGDIGPCVRMLSALTPRHGTFAVTGNHDCAKAPADVRAGLKRVGIHVLSNSSRSILPGLKVAGVEDYYWGGCDVDKAMRDVPASDAVIFLTHAGDPVKRLPGRGILSLAGHSHGGQVHLPFLPQRYRVWTHNMPYVRGWYRGGGNALYVNRGIGMTMLPLRFGSRPEVSVFVLRQSEDNGVYWRRMR